MNTSREVLTAAVAPNYSTQVNIWLLMFCNQKRRLIIFARLFAISYSVISMFSYIWEIFLEKIIFRIFNLYSISPFKMIYNSTFKYSLVFQHWSIIFWDQFYDFPFFFHKFILVQIYLNMEYATQMLTLRFGTIYALFKNAFIIFYRNNDI